MIKESSHLRLRNSKRRRIKIGIVADKTCSEGTIYYQIWIWIKNSMVSEVDVLPVVVNPRNDSRVSAAAKTLKCKECNGNDYEFLWVFWGGRGRGVLKEIREAALSGRRVIIFDSRAA